MGENGDTIRFLGAPVSHTVELFTHIISLMLSEITLEMHATVTCVYLLVYSKPKSLYNKFRDFFL